MSLNRRNPRRDANEPSIVKCLKRYGASVIRLSSKGAPDLLVCYRGRVVLMEVKTAKGRATSAQEATSAEGWPVVTVRTDVEAAEAIGAI